MQNFTGSHKKTIAGIGCALVIFFLPLGSFANDAAPIVFSETNPVVASTVTTTATNDAKAPAEITSTNTPVTAPVNTPKPATQKVSSASQLANLLGGLVLIIVLIYGLSWFVKRFSQGGFMHNPTMKIVSALPLGTRERLMLVDVGGKQILLGVSATQINTLHVFDEPIVNSEKVRTENKQPIASDFSQKLMTILQQKNFSPDDGSHKKSNS